MSIEHNSPKIFFIMGCQRSGTTLMRLVLESHSGISCVDEFRAYSLLRDSNLFSKELEINRNKKWVGFKTPRITEQLLEPFFADAGADFIGMTNHYSNTPVVFMVRNPLDTITSMKKLDQGGRSWLEMWAESTINFWQKTIPNFDNIYQDELRLLENTRFRSTVAGAIYWKIKTSSYYNYVNSTIPTILIRYEDLVTKPLPTISSVMDFLGLPWEDAVLKHEKLRHSELDETGLTIGKTDPKLPIYQSSLNQYSKYLSDDEIFEIITIVGELMKKLNYSISEYSLSGSRQIKSTFLPLKTISNVSDHSLEHLLKLLEYYTETIKGKDLQLTNLESAIKGKDLQLTNLESAIKGKDLQLTNLESAIKGKDLQLTDLESTINNIQKSIAWQILKKYDRIKDKFS